MATKTIDEGIRCADMAAEAGASWIDLNCGCEVLQLCNARAAAIVITLPPRCLLVLRNAGQALFRKQGATLVGTVLLHASAVKSSRCGPRRSHP